MSFLFPKPNAPASGNRPLNLDSDQLSTNQEAVPLPYFTGVARLAVHWISPAYNQRVTEVKEKVGKKETTVGFNYYADIAGALCLGPVDKVIAVIIDGETRWTGSLIRDISNPEYVEWVVGEYGTFRLYWGTDTQPVDDLVLKFSGTTNEEVSPDKEWWEFRDNYPDKVWTQPEIDNKKRTVTFGAIPDEHSAYRGQCYPVMKQLFFGQDRTSAPNVELIVERAARAPGMTLDEDIQTQGANSITTIAEILTEKRGGLNLNNAILNSSVLQTISNAFAAAPTKYYISPLVTRQQPARAVIGEIMSYFDGFARIKGGLIEVGYFPHDGVVPTVTELTLHELAGEPQIESPGWEGTLNQVTIVGRDRTRDLKENAEIGLSQYNRQVTGEPRHEVIQMPFFVDRAQERAYADEYAQVVSLPEETGRVPVRKEHAVNLDTTPLLPGDRFKLNYQPHGLNQIFRVTNRLDSGSDRNVELDFVAERGLFATPYTPPLDSLLGVQSLAPIPIVNARLVELPRKLAETELTTLTVLAERPAADIIGNHVWYSIDDSTYDRIGLQTSFAIRGTLNAAIDNAVTAIAITASGEDIVKLQPQSDEAKNDDSLLLFVEGEVISIGNVTAQGSNVYDLVTLRGRRGSSAAAHVISTVVWILPRIQLVRFNHIGFASTALRYFKLQSFNSTAVEDLANSLKINFNFSDRSGDKPAITFTTVPATAIVGVAVAVTGQIVDASADLQFYSVSGVKTSTGEEVIFASSYIPETDTFNFNVLITFPSDGTWKIRVRARDVRDDPDGYTELDSANITVSAGDGLFGPGDTTPPGPVTNVSITGGFEFLAASWTNPSDGDLGSIRIYVNSTTTKPGTVTRVVGNKVTTSFFENLPKNTTRYFWFEAVDFAGNVSADTGPHSGTTIAGIDLSHLGVNIGLVEIVSTLPTTGNFQGRTVFLTTDDKLYRHTGSAWTSAVPTTDLSGTITTTQISNNAISTPKLAANVVTAAKIAALTITSAELAANSIIAGKIAAAAVTAAAVGANEIIANTANIKNAIISSAKVINLDGDKIQANTIVAEKIIADEITRNFTVKAATASNITNNVWTEVASLTVSMTSGEVAIIQAGWGHSDDGTANTTDGDVRILASGTPVIQHDWTVTQGGTEMLSIGYLDDDNTPNKYQLQIRPRGGGTNGKPSVRDPHLSVSVLRR